MCCINACFSLTGAPVAVGMNIDIASIDMVSEVNMVGAPFPLSPCLDASDSLRGAAGIHLKWASYHGSACVTTCDRIGRTRALFGRIHFSGAGRRGGGVAIFQLYYSNTPTSSSPLSPHLQLYSVAAFEFKTHTHWRTRTHRPGCAHEGLRACVS